MPTSVACQRTLASIRRSIVATEIEKSSSRTVRRMISMASSSARSPLPAVASFRRACSTRDGAAFSSADSSAIQCRGVVRKVIGQRWGGAQDRRNPVQQARIPLKPREQLHAGRLPCQERVEPVEDRVRLWLAPQRREDPGKQLRQHLAGPLRAQSAYVSRLPASHRRDNALRIAESRVSAARLAVSFRRGLDTGEVQLQPFIGRRQRFRHQLEHFIVMRPDSVQMTEQQLRPQMPPRPRNAHERREPRPGRSRRLRQFVDPGGRR